MCPSSHPLGQDLITWASDIGTSLEGRSAGGDRLISPALGARAGTFRAPAHVSLFWRTAWPLGRRPCPGAVEPVHPRAVQHSSRQHGDRRKSPHGDYSLGSAEPSGKSYVCLQTVCGEGITHEIGRGVQQSLTASRGVGLESCSRSSWPS